MPYSTETKTKKPNLWTLASWTCVKTFKNCVESKGDTLCSEIVLCSGNKSSSLLAKFRIY